MSLLDTNTRCPLNYQATALHPPNPETLECRDYHDHVSDPLHVTITDPAAHFAAETAWSRELHSIAALPWGERNYEIRDRLIHDVDQDRIAQYASLRWPVGPGADDPAAPQPS